MYHGSDTVKVMEDARLEEILQKHFTNRFRKGYVNVEGVMMPVRFEEMQKEISEWEVNEDDVWICSFPKSGTTWTQEMVWMLLNNLNFEEGQVNLGARSPFFEVSALFDFRQLMNDIKDFQPPPFLQDSLHFIRNSKSPACIKTHLPFNLLPKAIQSGAKKPKIIYISRNPKDTCTSYYHHAKLMEGYTGNFNDFCRLFLAGKLCFAPYWNHVLPFWNRRHHFNVLFLTYEEMKIDLPSVIHRTAQFLEKSLTDQECALLRDHLNFESMKNNPSVNYELLIQMNKMFKIIDYEGKFMRSGIIGGYRDAMGCEMVEEFDGWTMKNTENTDFNIY